MSTQPKPQPLSPERMEEIESTRLLAANPAVCNGVGGGLYLKHTDALLSYIAYLEEEAKKKELLITAYQAAVGALGERTAELGQTHQEGIEK